MGGIIGGLNKQGDATNFLGECYDMSGSQSDPLRQRDQFGRKSFSVDDGNRRRSYLMPRTIEDIRRLKEYVRYYFPLEDMP